MKERRLPQFESSGTFSNLVNRLENGPIGPSVNLVGGEGSLVSLGWSFKMSEENQTGPPKFRPYLTNLEHRPIGGGPMVKFANEGLLSRSRLWRA